jgi:aspartyl-tRNA(Asn)/glutamyl-tRNA(Gln) amidotransferase subunit A
MEWAELTACDLCDRMARREVSCVELMHSVLAHVERREADLRAFTVLRPASQLLAEAAAIDERRRRGEILGSLAGLPIAIKDNICTRDAPTTCASRMLAGFVPPYDATVVRRLRAADGIILGKTNMDEFGMGSSTENSAWRPTRNPWRPGHVPGGSSGGSAVAVAAHEAVLALGADTGGSIRQPAAFCGVVGLKPTYGRVSRFGLIAYGSSLEQIGPLAKSVADAELLLDAISGPDPLDATTLPNSPARRRVAADRRRPLRVGAMELDRAGSVDAEVQGAISRALGLLAEAGCRVETVRIAHLALALPAYYILAAAEASSNLARYDGGVIGRPAESARGYGDLVRRTRTEAFGAEVKRRILWGAFVLSSGYYDAYYRGATRMRAAIRRELTSIFEQCDVVVLPVAPTAAFGLGEKTADPLAMVMGDVFTVLANLTGMPALSLPCGWTREGLPIGLQLLSGLQGEPTLLRSARLLEELLH